MIDAALALLALCSPAPAEAATAPQQPTPAASAPRIDEPPRRRARPSPRARPRASKPPWDWRFVGAHHGTGVMASLLVLPGSYALAGALGHRGKGLGPVVGAMLVGAFVPPVLVYTTQWAVGRRLAPRRERYWPGFLVSQVGHLAVFAGAVLGGASFHDLRDAAPVVLTDALLVTGLASLTAEATRRPAASGAPVPSGAPPGGAAGRHHFEAASAASAPFGASPGGAAGRRHLGIMVPVMEVRF